MKTATHSTGMLSPNFIRTLSKVSIKVYRQFGWEGLLAQEILCNIIFFFKLYARQSRVRWKLPKGHFEIVGASKILAKDKCDETS